MTADLIIANARQYSGVAETGVNNVLFNTAYYGRAVNGSAYPWCAVFVWYVFRQAGAASLYYGGQKTAYCPTLMAYYKTHKRFYKTAKVGDIVFYNFSGGKEAKHVGIVTEVGASYIKAIEGNTSSANNANGGMVQERRRSLSVCLGFARPAYTAPVTSESTTAKTEASRPTYAIGKTYTTQVELNVRTGPGTSYKAKTHDQLTASGQAHDTDRDGALDKGTRVTCNAVKTVGNDIWIQCPSGWIAAYYNNHIYVK